MLTLGDILKSQRRSLIKDFASGFYFEKNPKGIEIHICVPIEYEWLWSAKFTELMVSYLDACVLIGEKQRYLDSLHEEYEMVSEYADKYWRDRKQTEVEFHIQIPNNYEKLWTTKLAELTVTDEEIEEYRDDVGSM
jgi:hypothetical protein